MRLRGLVYGEESKVREKKRKQRMR